MIDIFSYFITAAKQPSKVLEFATITWPMDRLVMTQLYFIQVICIENEIHFWK